MMINALDGKMDNKKDMLCEFFTMTKKLKNNLLIINMYMEDLPIVTFGKYKGKSVLELISDKNYVEWLKQQPWFTSQKTIYNIVINQQLNEQNVNSKTPEHNKIQNKFLDREYQLKFINYTSNCFTRMRLSNNLLKLPELGEYFDVSKGNVDVDDIEISVEFESNFNWDVVIWCYIRAIGSLPIKECREDDLSPELRAMIEQASCAILFKGLRELISCIRFEQSIKFFCEIKPILGDDYPCVLRKMKKQIKLTYDHERCYAFRWFLIIQNFTSDTTTREQLIQIFKQENIKVIFTDEIQNSLVDFNETNKNVDCQPTRELLQEIIKQLKHDIEILQTKNKQLDCDIITAHEEYKRNYERDLDTINKLKGDNKQLNDDKLTMQKQIKQLNVDKKKLQKELDDLSDEFVNHRVDEQIIENNKDLFAETLKLGDIVESLKKENKQLKKTIKQLRNQLGVSLEPKEEINKMCSRLSSSVFKKTTTPT